MNKEEAIEILGGDIKSDKGLSGEAEYISWNPTDDTACLDGHFTADKLEAIAWWMRNNAQS